MAQQRPGRKRSALSIDEEDEAWLRANWKKPESKATVPKYGENVPKKSAADLTKDVSSSTTRNGEGARRVERRSFPDRHCRKFSTSDRQLNCTSAGNLPKVVPSVTVGNAEPARFKENNRSKKRGQLLISDFFSKPSSRPTPGDKCKDVVSNARVVNDLISRADKTQSKEIRSSTKRRDDSPKPVPLEKTRRVPSPISPLNDSICIIEPTQPDETSVIPKTLNNTSSTAVSTPVPLEKKRRPVSPVLSPNDSIFNASFDELKKPEKPEGIVVVRKKDERRKLRGHECKCCEKYFDALNLDPEERAKRVNAVSRHRSTYRPFVRAKTPDDFWDLGMPDTQQLYDRGYLKRLWDTNEEASKK